MSRNSSSENWSAFAEYLQMLSDLVLRSVNDIAPNAFEPVIEEGVRDGSLSVMFPKQAAEAVSLIANIWINPLVFLLTTKS